MSKLAGARVALLEARMSGELASLVERNGGDPYTVPAVRESDIEAGVEVSAFLDQITAGECQVVIFLTGVGARRLFASAERLGRLPELLGALRQVTTVCRGPKPVAVLRKVDLQVNITAREPHTTSELLEALEKTDLNGIGVALQHYGERNDALATALLVRGARLIELTLYEWLLPEDTEPLNRLVDEMIAGSVDAVAFTSQVQIRHLFKVAADRGLEADLTHALNDRVIVASVGPTCTSVLNGLGVHPRVEPQHPKMGPMVLALSAYVEREGLRR
jgi:uroporphyrinogen-III synthase